MPSKYRTPMCVSIFLLICSTGIAIADEPVASRIVNGTMQFYYSLHEAIIDANGSSPEAPDEIALLSDITVYAPLIIEDNQHIRLTAAGDNRTIMRGMDFLDYPVIWVRGENSSLTLGSESSGIYELVIDGGFSHGIEAHSPLVALNGPDSLLVMHDNVFLQNNNNSGSGLAPATYYQNGGAVYIRTFQDNFNRPAEFIMRGGTIRGNVNNIQNPYPYGGGVFVHSGIFTMEGGSIMDNSALHYGGGVYITNRGIFRKTGGIIYGINAPEAYRNTASIYQGLKPYGHAVLVGDIGTSLFRFRNDTIGENENLTFTSTYAGEGFFGSSENWHDQYTVLRHNFLIAGVIVLTAAWVFIIIRKRTGAAVMRKPAEEGAVLTQGEIAAQPNPALTGIHFSPREKEVLDLLLKGLSFRDISNELHLSISGVKHHSQNIYRKLGIQSRTELLVKYK